MTTIYSSSESDVSSNKKCVYIVVYGRVQGVGYREFVCKVAKHFQLTGWVHNMPDGRVEAVVRISHQILPKLVTFLKQGTPSSKVIRVSTKEISSLSCPIRGFDIIT